MKYYRSHPICYKGHHYPTLKSAWESNEHVCEYPLFVKRIRDGWRVKDALMKSRSSSGRCHPISHNGKEYRSIKELYDTVCANIRRQHKKPRSAYETFASNIIKFGADEAVYRMRKTTVRKDGELVRYSRALGGSDNLVCQRMTKLGWSRERAESTPVKNIVPKKQVNWYGKIYRSMRACFAAEHPAKNIATFSKMCREHNYVFE